MSSPYAPDSRRRRSIRLKGFDYTLAGAYFVTVVVQGRACLFGEIVDGNMCLNNTGLLASEAWQWLGTQYPYVVLDEFVVMAPRHHHDHR